AAVEALAHVVGRRHVAAVARNLPEPRHQQVDERIDDDRVRDREQSDRALVEHERRDGDERVRGVEVAAEEEPGDDRAEPPAAEAPLVEVLEAPRRPPAWCDEAEIADAGEEEQEDPELAPDDP